MPETTTLPTATTIPELNANLQLIHNSILKWMEEINNSPTLLYRNRSSRAEHQAVRMHQTEYLTRSELDNMFSEEHHEAKITAIAAVSNTSTPLPTFPTQYARPQYTKPNSPFLS